MPLGIIFLSFNFCPFYWFKANSEVEVEEEQHAELAPTTPSRSRTEELIEVFQRQADRVGGPTLFSYKVREGEDICDAVCDERKMIEHADFIRDVFATGGLSMPKWLANTVLAKIWKYNYKSWKEKACDMKRWRDNQQDRARRILHVAGKAHKRKTVPDWLWNILHGSGNDVALENPEAEIVEPEVAKVPVKTEKRRRSRKTTDEILPSPIKRYESK